MNVVNKMKERSMNVVRVIRKKYMNVVNEIGIVGTSFQDIRIGSKKAV